eukprot:scaffold16943_cov121-Isochrysis_galbana.AAC.2
MDEVFWGAGRACSGAVPAQPMPLATFCPAWLKDGPQYSLNVFGNLNHLIVGLRVTLPVCQKHRLLV